MAKKKFYNMNGREAMREGSGMIKEDRSAPSNLPREMIDKYWPDGQYYMGIHEADLFMGSQKQLREDGQGMRREAKPGKY